ncbi:MAG: malonic semialdehyde reductase [Alphaproteobacteria bacterium]|nr:malonic semialdehyde reductase [Alphaproteobacteria bacterium]
MPKISQPDLDILFNNARTYYAWTDQKVSDDVLKQLYDLAKMGPTAANCQPMRVVFVVSEAAKKRLEPCLDSGNVQKMRTAPVTAIVGGDAAFYTHFDKLYPPANVRVWYEGKPDLIEETLQRNTALQGAYLIMAARALGLDCGPMSGFNAQMVDEAFFKGTTFKSNFLCNLGYGSKEKMYPRLPRFDFEEACQIE